MRKFQIGFKVLTNLRSYIRGDSTRQIKLVLGDSVNNNRTLTVSQLIRFLDKEKVRHLAQAVETISTILEPEVLKRRNNRTDAIDVSELVNTYRTVVMNNKKLRREIGAALSKVG